MAIAFAAFLQGVYFQFAGSCRYTLSFRLQMKRVALCCTILMLFIRYSSVGSQTEDANSTCGRQRLRCPKSLAS